MSPADTVAVAICLGFNDIDVGLSGFAREGGGEHNYKSTFAAAVLEQVVSSNSKNTVVSADTSRIAAEDAVAIGVPCGAAEGAQLGKPQSEAEAPPRGRIYHSAEGRSYELTLSMSFGEKLSEFLVVRA